MTCPEGYILQNAIEGVILQIGSWLLGGTNEQVPSIMLTSILCILGV